MFTNILFQRLRPHVEKIVGICQCGFRDVKSILNQLHTLRQILEKWENMGLTHSTYS